MRRGESKCKGPEMRAWTLVGGKGRRLGREGQEGSSTRAETVSVLCLSGGKCTLSIG